MTKGGLRILHVIKSVDPASGGPIEGIVRQDAACRAAGQPGVREVLSLDAPDAPFLGAVAMTVHALGRPRSASRLPWKRILDHWGYSPDFLPWLRANARRYDAVIVNGVWNYAPFAASRVLPGGATPYFVFTHGMLDPWFRRTYPLKHLAKQAFWLVGEGRLLAGARSVFFTCEAERRKARGEFRGQRAYVETVVGYGAAAPPRRTPALAAAFHAAAPRLGDRPYILFLGRIHPKKGCDLLIEAFARVASANPGIDLVMAGPDPSGWGVELEGLSERLGIGSRVHWTGPIYRDAKWGALYRADAFILPSHQENFGIAVAEALGCGTPVLISDQVDIWREIEDAGAGFVQPDTLEGAVALLETWFGASRAERRRMGARAKALFQDRFDVGRTAPDLLDTMEAML